MFTPEFFIDSIQDGKKQFVNTFVQHAGLKKAMNDFVDSQTAYTKSAVKSSTEVSAKISAEGIKAFTEVTKIDVTKFDFSKLFGTSK